MRKFLKSKWSPSLTAICIMSFLMIIGVVQAVFSATTIGSNITTEGSLTVANAVYASSTVLVDGAATVNGNVTLGDAIGDTLSITGRISSTLNASSTLLVGGAAIFDGNVTLGDAIGDTLSITGRISSTLNASSTALFGSGLTSYGTVTLQNGATITNPSSGVMTLGAGTNVAGQATTTVNGVVIPTSRTAEPIACDSTVEGGFSYNFTKKIICVCNGTAWVTATSSNPGACF